jgi:hypothetical protein
MAGRVACTSEGRIGMNDRGVVGLIVLAIGASATACKEEGGSTAPGKAAASVLAGERTPAESHRPEGRAAQAAFEFKGVGERLVKSIGGFTIATTPRYFGPDNLYTLINGGADSYVSLGLREMVTADYTSRARPKVTVTVEIYDMADPKNASARFSKFLQGRQDPSSAGKGLPAGMQGRSLLGSGQVSFWKAQYIVNTTLLDESDTASTETMAALGSELLPVFAKVMDDAL